MTGATEEPKPLVLAIGTEARRLTLRPDEALAVILPEGARLGHDDLALLRHRLREAELPCPVLVFEHGTELAVVAVEGPDRGRPTIPPSVSPTPEGP